MATHSAHCKLCKANFALFLNRIYGAVEIGYSLRLPSTLNGYSGQTVYENLKTIFSALQRERGHNKFTGTRQLPPVDFYAPRLCQIIEFDEPQHFTALRAISLDLYPSSLRLRYDRKLWRKRCVDLDRHDNSPIYRDEQRAWYDTLRDFAPASLGYPPIIRIFASDAIWCEMNPCSQKDMRRFKTILGIQD